MSQFLNTVVTARWRWIGRFLGRLGAQARQKVLLIASAVLAVAAAALATSLPTDAGTNTLVDTDTPSYRATQELRGSFGDDPVVVLARSDLQNLLLTSNLGQLLRPELRLSGKVRRGKADPAVHQTRPSSGRSGSSPGRRRS